MDTHALIQNGVVWAQKDERATPDHLGFIPEFVHANDPRPVREQLEENYGCGALYVASGFTETENGDLNYPGDPALPLLYEATFRGERIRMYAHAFVSVLTPGQELFITRMD